LKCDLLVSRFAFTFNLCRYTAEMEIDVRDIDGVRRDEVVAKIVAKGEEIAARRKVRWTHAMINADPPATCAPQVVAAAAAAAQRMGLSAKRMVSRAYHDSLFMAGLVQVEFSLPI
jgi:ureidoglycolate amidohydrolase